MLGYHCPWTLSVPRSAQLSSIELRSQTVRFSEEIMSVNRYPSIFSRQNGRLDFCRSLGVSAGSFPETAAGNRA